ncbi:MAG: ribose-phosphate pyrophosphokinase [Patescibacteria group bacterium]
MDYPFHIFGLGSNDPFAALIAESLKVPLGKMERKPFSDGEIFLRFHENLRRKHVFLVQSTNQPDSNLMALEIAIDAARRASAGEITAVIPYFGYARQDRKNGPRQPITASMIALKLEALGIDRVITMDLHANQIEGFFRHTPVDNLYARKVFTPYLKARFADPIARNNLTVIAPDVGAVGRAQSYAVRMMDKARLAIFHKGRLKPNEVDEMILVGDVTGQECLIVDDMADTCTTLARSAEILIERGATEVYAAVAHGVLSGKALERLEASPIKRLFITDTIAQVRSSPKLEVVSVAGLFAETIARVERGESVSVLFEDTH